MCVCVCVCDIMMSHSQHYIMVMSHKSTHIMVMSHSQHYMITLWDGVIYYIMVVSYITSWWCHILHHDDVTYGHGMSLTGMKKPLVNPATLEMTGDRRKAW